VYDAHVMIFFLRE